MAKFAIQRRGLAQTKYRGYSLIELLTVLFIIGLLSGLVTLNINYRDSSNSANDLQQQMDNFLSAAHLAEDQAVLTGRPYGLVIEPPNIDHYWQFSWQTYSQGQWLQAEVVFESQSFGEDVELAAEVEGEAVEFDKIILSDDEKPRLPSIIFYPGGEVTPFTMTLYNDFAIDESVMISSEITGTVQLLEEGEFYEELLR